MLSHLYEVRLDSGGYHRGTYWGSALTRNGAGRLYFYSHAEGEGYLRAKNRADAKRRVLELWPNARFYR